MISKIRDLNLKAVKAAVTLTLCLLTSQQQALNAQDASVPGNGILTVRVFERQSEDPLPGVTLGICTGKVGITNAAGRYQFADVPQGTYTLSLIADGYRSGVVTDIQIIAGEDQVILFPMDQVASAPTGDEEGMLGEIFEMEEFVITASVLMDSDFVLRQMRFESNLAVDTLSSADFKKFAAGDVGEVLLKIPGITVQDSKFAVIRGLDERYTSTLFNGAPVPSPDPEKQSVPLDLFPSEIVGTLIVSKTFSPDQPGNSVGGSIAINTAVFPEAFEASVSGSVGFNDNARDQFLSDGNRPQIKVDLNNLNSPENEEIANTFAENSRLTPLYEDAPLDREFNIELGGTHVILGREFRYFATASAEQDYRSTSGMEEKRSARNGLSRGGTLILRDGDLARGVLSRTSGNYDLLESTFENRETVLLSFEYDISTSGNHRVGATSFYNDLAVERASLRYNGTFENADLDGNGLDPSDIRSLGGIADRLLSFLGNDFEEFTQSSFYRTNVVDESRTLRVNQIRGSHLFSDNEDGLQLNWDFSMASTSQDEIGSINTAGIQLPDGSFVTGTDTNNSFNSFMRPTLSWRSNREDQMFGRIDVKNKFQHGENFSSTIEFGAYVEDTDRDVYQEFYIIDKNFKDAESLSPSFPTREEAMQDKYAEVNPSIDSGVDALSSREITAGYLSTRFAYKEKIDVTFGFRVESIAMDTSTSSTGDFFNFELLRDSAGQAPTPLTAIINSTIMGLPGPLAPGFTGQIDEDKFLPMVAVNYRIADKWRFLMSFTQTVARPSFREFTYVTNQDPVTLNYVSGNPTLITSDVNSYDIRLEYLFPEGTDLIAFSLFQKTVQDPIEKTILAGKVDTEIFFNNPNEADVKGFEIEAKRDLVFLDNKFLKSFSIGGNVTYIDAQIEIPENMIKLLSGTLELPNGSVLLGDYFLSSEAEGRLPAPQSRQLFSQPEWIANFDISYYQATFGTRVTLSVFTQSKVLITAAGTTGTSGTAVPDRYMDAYHTLNLSLSQPLGDHFSLGFSVKNITDSERKLIYDPSVVSTGPERVYRTGRSFNFSLTGSF